MAVRQEAVVIKDAGDLNHKAILCHNSLENLTSKIETSLGPHRTNCTTTTQIHIHPATLLIRENGI